MVLITRRRVLGLSIAGATAASYPTLIEPRWLELTRTRLTLPGPPGPPIRVLQLTDLHASWAVPLNMIDVAVDVGLNERPDIVCLTGDFITHRYDFDVPAYTRALRKLSASRPTFAIFGNHDGGVWAKQRRGFADHSLVERILRDSAITLLHNRAQPIEAHGRKINLVGVGDFWSGELDAATAFHSVSQAHPTVLLSHNPDSKEAVHRYKWDLMLCGHTHGGQVIIPFEGPRYAPVNDLRFVAGLKLWDGRHIYISRGVGNVGMVRFRCRPEVTVFDLHFA